MASVMYTTGKVKMLDGSIDLDTDTIKVALVTSSYTPDVDTHDFFDDVTNEVTGDGYTAGGATLASVSVAEDTANNRAEVNANTTTWSSSTITARGAVIYKSTGTAGTSPLICYIDFGEDKVSSSGTFSIDWNDSDGIFAW